MNDPRKFKAPYFPRIPEVEYGWVEWQAGEFAGRNRQPLRISKSKGF